MTDSSLFNLTVGAIGGPASQRPMGLGVLGFSELVFKRKFRWTIAIQYCPDGIGGYHHMVAEEFVKVGARPQLDIEETEINYLHGKFWIPGKVTFQTMTVTYYDVSGVLPMNPGPSEPSSCAYHNDTDEYTVNQAPEMNSVFNWIASVYDITDPCNLHMGSHLSDFMGNARILMFDGCGVPLEGWLLKRSPSEDRAQRPAREAAIAGQARV